MPATPDAQGFPTCCGYRLQAEPSTTQCPFCYRRYDTGELADIVREWRGMNPHPRTTKGTK